MENQVLKKEMVGEAVFPQMGDCKALAEGAGETAGFDKKSFFRATPAPEAL